MDTHYENQKKGKVAKDEKYYVMRNAELRQQVSELKRHKTDGDGYTYAPRIQQLQAAIKKNSGTLEKIRAAK